MNEIRLWRMGAIVLVIVLLAGTWFLGVSPRLDEAAAANSDRSDAELMNQRHEITLAALKEQHEGIDALKAELDALHLSVPTEADLPLLIGQIKDLAAAAGVTITSLTFGDPAGYGPPTAEQAEVDVVDEELSAALSSVTPETLLQIPVGITMSGPYAQVMSFISSLQQGQRLVLVHSVNLNTGPLVVDGVVDMAIAAQAFVFLESGSAPVADDVVGATTEADAVVEGTTAE